jgi:hypothetical protein
MPSRLITPFGRLKSNQISSKPEKEVVIRATGSDRRLTGNSLSMEV